MVASFWDGFSPSIERTKTSKYCHSACVLFGGWSHLIHPQKRTSHCQSSEWTAIMVKEWFLRQPYLCFVFLWRRLVRQKVETLDSSCWWICHHSACRKQWISACNWYRITMKMTFSWKYRKIDQKTFFPRTIFLFI